MQALPTTNLAHNIDLQPVSTCHSDGSTSSKLPTWASSANSSVAPGIGSTAATVQNGKRACEHAVLESKSHFETAY